MSKVNCWEYMQCGREYGGAKEAEMGICPAVTNFPYAGKNGGRSAGRICWRVAGTFCHDELQGTYAKKMMSCGRCNFFLLVRSEEGRTFVE